MTPAVLSVNCHNIAVIVGKIPPSILGLPKTNHYHLRKGNPMKVKNINGTSQNTCKCGSWLQHWKNHSGQSLPSYCPETSCLQKPEVGAHVQKDNSADNSWYIIPLCKTHNAETGKSLTVSDSIVLVSANVSKTCDKST